MEKGMVGSVGEFLELREKMEGNEMIGEDGGEGVEGSVGGGTRGDTREPAVVIICDGGLFWCEPFSKWRLHPIHPSPPIPCRPSPPIPCRPSPPIRRPSLLARPRPGPRVKRPGGSDAEIPPLRPTPTHRPIPGDPPKRRCYTYMYIVGS
ncbi:hypothetical protein KC19_9G090700 [Ceratodon purpureus]|uniref:Uncharacterized protein n=1 Tax=Ceratodon purpureus TaxID=3225 RepID=A0A8T0GXZ6_CERPU|nr:hypothetical protein KC19_9G090700 [Ceratodon purpureus]